MLQMIYVLNKEILQFVGLKSVVSNQERVIMVCIGYDKMFFVKLGFFSSLNKKSVAKTCCSRASKSTRKVVDTPQ